MDMFSYDELKKFNNVVIFGYTPYGRRVCAGIRKIFMDTDVSFCDNDKMKQKRHDEAMCYSVEDAVALFPSAAFVIISEYSRDGMTEQLVRLGINRSNIIYGLPEDVFVQVLEENYRKKTQRLTLREFHFEINIVKHCNLNCRGCNHFSPLASNDFMSVSVIENDVRRLGELFHHTASRIYLLGGEPLLHPQIEEIAKICREHFPETKIFIVTNGILLANMSESFWKCCKDNKIIISPTRYPIKIDYDSLSDLANSHGVEYFMFGGTDFYARKLWFEPIDICGSHDVDDEFKQCRQANKCITLENGKLYTCILPPTIQAFNSYFGYNLEVTEEDGIDIYKAKSYEEVLDFFTHPIPFCKYCDWKSHTYENPYGISKKDIKEWTL